MAGKLTVLVKKMDDKDLEAAAVSSTKNNWTKYFKDKNCLYSGKVESLKAANELIHEYSLETITTFVVWRTERKNFGSTGKDF